MIFEATAYFWLAGAAALVLGAIVYLVLWLVQKKNRKLRIISALAVLVVSRFVFSGTGTDVLVIYPDSAEEFVALWEDSIVVGEKKYELWAESNYGKFIINKTGKPLVFETVDYGNPSIPRLDFGVSFFQPDTIESFSDFPDYFPWEVPPGSVSVTKGVRSDMKEWARYATEEELSEAEDRRQFEEMGPVNLGNEADKMMQTIKDMQETDPQ